MTLPAVSLKTLIEGDNGPQSVYVFLNSFDAHSVEARLDKQAGEVRFVYPDGNSFSRRLWSRRKREAEYDLCPSCYGRSSNPTYCSHCGSSM